VGTSWTIVTTQLLIRETTLNHSLAQQLEELIDDRVFSFAQAAQKHYKTNDLVVFLDLMEQSPELEAIPRQRLAESNAVPEDIRQKVSVPASELSEVLGSPTQSFWFFVILETEETFCVAINASMMAPGGTA
jgi:hypothetical protein